MDTAKRLRLCHQIIEHLLSPTGYLCIYRNQVLIAVDYRRKRSKIQFPYEELLRKSQSNLQAVTSFLKISFTVMNSFFADVTCYISSKINMK